MVLRIGKKLSKLEKYRVKLFFDSWRQRVGGHTASLQTYELFADLCQSATGTVIDMGSGFGSYLIREFNTGMYDPISVDIKKWRLDLTHEFCFHNHQNDGSFILWKEFQNRMWMDLSLILFNIGNTGQRLNYFKPVFDKYLHKGVRILINDAHKTAVRAHLQRLLKLYEHRYLGVKEQTLDEYGRFCVLIEGK
jgi:hypothetical protein